MRTAGAARVVVLLVAAAPLLTAALPGAAPPPVATPAAAAAAASSPAAADAGPQAGATLVLPAIVEVIQEVRGSIVDDRDGSVHGPYDASFAGTGFFVSATGDIVTAAHVAAPTDAEITDELVSSYIDDRYGCDPGTAADGCASVEAAHHDEVLSHGQSRGVSLRLRVLLQSMRVDDSGLPVTVVSASRSTGTDVAVLHLAGVTTAPVALLGSEDARPGLPLSILGYPQSAREQTSLAPQVSTGRVTAVLPPDPSSEIAPRAHLLEVNALILEGNSGGPGVAGDGTVRGIVSYGVSERDNFLVAAGDVRAQLAQAGTHNSLGPVDLAWRAGLAAEAERDPARAIRWFDRCSHLFAAAVQCAAHARAERALLPSPRTERAAWMPSLWLILLAVGVLLGAGGAAMLIRRHR